MNSLSFIYGDVLMTGSDAWRLPTESLDTRADTPLDDDGLAKLVKFGIYEAMFLASGTHKGRDGQFNPIVFIIDPKEQDHTYEGELVFSTSIKHGDAANDVRQRVIDLEEGAGKFFIKVIGTPALTNDRYAVIGSAERTK